MTNSRRGDLSRPREDSFSIARSHLPGKRARQNPGSCGASRNSGRGLLYTAAATALVDTLPNPSWNDARELATATASLWRRDLWSRWPIGHNNFNDTHPLFWAEVKVTFSYTKRVTSNALPLSSYPSFRNEVTTLLLFKGGKEYLATSREERAQLKLPLLVYPTAPAWKFQSMQKKYIYISPRMR